MSWGILNDTRKPAVACLRFERIFVFTLLFSCIHPGRIETFPESPHIYFPVRSAQASPCFLVYHPCPSFLPISLSSPLFVPFLSLVNGIIVVSLPP